MSISGHKSRILKHVVGLNERGLVTVEVDVVVPKITVVNLNRDKTRNINPGLTVGDNRFFNANIRVA
jgi:hypothetical protein